MTPTYEQARDRLAELMGHDHPIPDSLDGLIALLPEGWEWYKVLGDWHAFPPRKGKPLPGPVVVEDTGNPVVDFTRILCAVIEKVAPAKDPTP